MTKDIVLLTTGCLLGFVVALLLEHFELVNYDSAISAGNIMKSVTTVLSAMFVTLYLQRLVQGQRRQNELVLQQLELLHQCVIVLDEFGSSEKWTDVTRALKKLSTKSRFVNKVTKNCKYARNIVDACNFESKVTAVRKLLTDTPAKDANGGTPKYPAVVVNNVITWDAIRIDEIDTEIEVLKSAIFEAQVLVNAS